MKIDPAKNRIFQLGDQGRLVAINEENQRVLAHNLGLYGNMDRVPADKTVRGVFVKITPDGFVESLDDSMQQNDITINELRAVPE